MREKYFNNIKVRVVTELDNKQSVIEFITGLCDYQDEFSQYSEPIEQRIVVFNNQLTDNPILKNDIVLERERMLKEIEEFKNKKINESNNHIRNEYNQIQSQIKELKKELQELEKVSPYIKTAKKWINNDYKFCVLSYGKIITIDELKNQFKDDTMYEDKIKYDNLFIRVSENAIYYSRSSYNTDTYFLCETLEEAKEKLKECLLKIIKNNISIHHLEEVDKWGVVIEELEKERINIINKHNENILKQIKQYEDYIISHKERIICR